MNREIKFRIWNSTVKEMTILDFKNRNIHLSRLYVAVLADEIKREGAIMQYTGLHDRTGKEVYEGDVVNGPYGIRLVEWCPADGAWSMKDRDGNAYRFLREWVSIHEVIGNIYDNPDLIK